MLASRITSALCALLISLCCVSAGLALVTVECFAPAFAGTVTLKLFTYANPSGTHGTTTNVTVSIPAGVTPSQKAALIENAVRTQAPWINTLRWGNRLFLDVDPGLECTGAVDGTGEIMLVDNSGIGVPVTYRTRIKLSGMPLGGDAKVGENGQVRTVATAGKSIPQIYQEWQSQFGEGRIDGNGFHLPARTTIGRQFEFEVTDPGLTVEVEQDRVEAIGVCFSSTDTFGEIDVNGATALHTTSGFGGVARAILWDPQSPSDLLLGGQGFLGRATLPAPVSYGQIPGSNALMVRQMSWSANGQLHVADAASGQVLRVDPTTGNAANLTSGPQPWGNTMACGAIHPTTGDFFVGSAGRIDRVPAGTSTGVPFVSGLGGSVSSLTFDPVTGDVVATLPASDRIVRISMQGNTSDLVPVGTVIAPRAIDVDGRGRFVVGASNGDVCQIPNNGGSCTTISSLSGPGILIGLTVYRTVPQPRFRMDTSSLGQGGLRVSMSDIPSGATEGWTLLSFDTSLPVGGGSAFGLQPDTTTFGLLAAFPIAQPGHPVHWTWPSLSFPHAPLIIPAGLATGVPMDFIGVTLGTALHTTPVQRIVLD